MDNSTLINLDQRTNDELIMTSRTASTWPSPFMIATASRVRALIDLRQPSSVQLASCPQQDQLGSKQFDAHTEGTSGYAADHTFGTRWGARPGSPPV